MITKIIINYKLMIFNNFHDFYQLNPHKKSLLYFNVNKSINLFLINFINNLFRQ